MCFLTETGGNITELQLRISELENTMSEEDGRTAVNQRMVAAGRLNDVERVSELENTITDQELHKTKGRSWSLKIQ